MADVIRRSALAIGALLGAWHLWLLGHQASSGQLSDAATALRWLVAIVLLTGLVSLWRRGESMTGRPAVAVWVLATLLHGPALANDLDGFVTAALPEAVASVAQTAAAVAAMGLALLLRLRHTGRAFSASIGLRRPVDTRLLPTRAPAYRLRFLPRPPPLA